jgi:hypothetical protein
MASLNFNLSDLDDSLFEDQPSFEPVPQDTYTLMITDSDMVQTKNGNGQMLKLTMQIVDGAHKGRKIWDNLNLINSSTTAVEIAQRNLGSICKAIGVASVTESAVLHNKPFKAFVGIEIGTNGYSDKNRVKKYDHRPLGGGVTPAPQVQAAPQAAATTSAAPWAK